MKIRNGKEYFTAAVKEYCECPRCGFNFDEGEEIEVSVNETVECDNCDLEIYVVLNTDDWTVEL